TAVTCAWHASRNARSARYAIFAHTSTRRRRIAPARPVRADRRRLGTFDESVPSPSSQRLCRRAAAPLVPRFFWTSSRRCYSGRMHKQIDAYTERMATRFRGFLPVVVDVETGGFDAQHDALLEIAAVVVSMDGDGMLAPEPVVSTHVEVFPGAHIDPKSLEVTGIDPDQP